MFTEFIVLYVGVGIAILLLIITIIMLAVCMKKISNINQQGGSRQDIQGLVLCKSCKRSYPVRLGNCPHCND